MKTSHLQVLRAIALPAALVLAGAAHAQMINQTNGMLTGEKGMTLYTFDKDAANSGKSVCNGNCEKNWPPAMAGASDKASGAYSVITRDDGKMQWAYKGKPLYYFMKDEKAGDTKGDGVGSVWHTATP
jgi:predicted lipoprotein with Yx(FWY)xxD motif